MLRWKDQLDLAEKTGEKLDNKEAKEYNNKMYKVLDKLSFNKTDITDLQKENGMIVGSKPDMPFWSWRVADGLIFGQIGECPECKTQGLYYNGHQFICKVKKKSILILKRKKISYIFTSTRLLTLFSYFIGMGFIIYSLHF